MRIKEVKTDPALLRRLKNAATQLTESEMEEQTVSFVMGIMGHKQGMSRDEVRRMLDRQRGRAVAE
ncbi:MAG: hypothetical protein ACYYKD_08250 [Rhodospirillales bacterium]